MNCLHGHITHLKTHEGIYQITFIAPPLTLHCITLTPNEPLHEGMAIEALFKETEVALSREASSTLSIANQLPCDIKVIQQGAILSEITLHTSQSPIRSIITTDSLKRLDLCLGESVYALIKANEISIKGLPC